MHFFYVFFQLRIPFYTFFYTSKTQCFTQTGELIKVFAYYYITKIEGATNKPKFKGPSTLRFSHMLGVKQHDSGKLLDLI